ncbi:MAG: flagellar biosynthesis protein FlhB [Gammaproteobacteria bacterium]
MAEQDSGQEKSQEATEKRKADARKEGQIPRSRELNTFAMILASTAGLMLFGPGIVEEMNSIMVTGFTPDRAVFSSPSQALALFASLLGDALLSLAPLLALLTVVALAAPMLLGGFNFSAKAFAPKFDRINPIKGLGRLFSAHGAMELGKAILKLTVILAVVGLWLKTEANDLLMLGRLPFEQGMQGIAELVVDTLIMVVAPLGLIALIDAPMQVFQNTKKLKMSMQEIKDEYKESEGNPEMKGQMRRAAQEMSGKRTADRVPEADVVITNPTHYAVALAYDEDTMAAPIVVAKGTDLLAAHIRTLAAQNDIPIVPAPPLARALHYSTEVDESIPDGLYLAVAHVLSYVYQLRLVRRKAWRGRRAPHLDGESLHIPEELRHD